jgi:AmmeMemoRadiSam system protein B
MYSGPNAAWAYKNIISPETYSRVVLLGPTHRLQFRALGMTGCTVWETPIGDLEIDLEGIEKLYKIFKEKNLGNLIGLLPVRAEEDEHSLEMHCPYIRKVFPNVKLLPITVG